jgi:hypothetical protein
MPTDLGVLRGFSTRYEGVTRAPRPLGFSLGVLSAYLSATEAYAERDRPVRRPLFPRTLGRFAVDLELSASTALELSYQRDEMTRYSVRDAGTRGSLSFGRAWDLQSASFARGFESSADSVETSFRQSGEHFDVGFSWSNERRRSRDESEDTSALIAQQGYGSFELTPSVTFAPSLGVWQARYGGVGGTMNGFWAFPSLYWTAYPWTFTVYGYYDHGHSSDGGWDAEVRSGAVDLEYGMGTIHGGRAAVSVALGYDDYADHVYSEASRGAITGGVYFQLRGL